MPPVVPAELAFAGDGTPYSAVFGDIYHSAQGGLEQARHVFIAGNRLPQRWLERERFVILETGFGIGLNFLATWQAWNRHRGQARRLHYVAVESHPFGAANLARLHARWPELAPQAARLREAWPPALPGLHRLEFGDVVLTLALGDAQGLLPQLSLAADALYLDGFAPERNPQLWSEQTLAEMRRLAAPGATLATWTVAGEVCRRLAGLGFTLERAPGFGGKREMLRGVLPGRPRENPRPPLSVAVIGAGIAGSSVASLLAARGCAVTVLDAAPAPAQGASGNPAAVFRPLPSRGDGPLARVLRAGFLHGRRLYARLPAVRAGWTGVLHLSRDPRHEASQRAIAEEQAMPEEFCRFVNADEAATLSGWPVCGGGWWFPQAGWINPPSLCRALLDGIALLPNFRAERVQPTADGWRVIGNAAAIDADTVVVANGTGAVRLLPDAKLPIRSGRGQLSLIAESATPALDIVVTRLGYVTPAIDGIRCAGATMHAEDPEPCPRIADHVENLFRLEMALPAFARNLDPANLAGRVSFRPMSPDRLPLAGPIPGRDGLWICNGFGARGLVFASICAELLASRMFGEPLPLEQDLAAALDPARFGDGRKQRRRRAL